MYRRARKAVAILTVALIILCLARTETLAVSATSKAAVDLYTQKEPFDGRGPNVSSDAFTPQQEVQIYAYVTYNDAPSEGVFVAFEISGPSNDVENVTFGRSAMTNEHGIAEISFRLPYLERITFGEWRVLGNVQIADYMAQDTVTFEVGWIIQIISLKTVNESRMPQNSFAADTMMSVELVLSNIAMTDRTAVLTIGVYDELNILVNSTEMHEFVVQANATPVYVYVDFFLPRNSTVGDATVRANAFTNSISQGGVPYCPEVATGFTITAAAPIHDVTVTGVLPLSTLVYAGNNVDIQVSAKNVGDVAESFNVTVYCDSMVIGNLMFVNLGSGIPKTLPLKWDTKNVQLGNYTLKAVADTVSGETNVENNLYVDGVIRVVQSPGGQYFPDWFFWLLLLLLAALIIIVVVWWYRRRKKKQAAGGSFQTGWAAWYYSYDLFGRTKEN